MRDIKITYNHIKNIRGKAETIIKDLEKRDLLDDEIEEEILSAKSLDALDHLVRKTKNRFSTTFQKFTNFVDSYLVCTT